MITFSAFGFAFTCVFIFFCGIIAEWFRKDIKRMEETHNAYKIGYRIGFQTAELKFAPHLPVLEDFEDWPPVTGSPFDPAKTRMMETKSAHECPKDFQRDGATFNFRDNPDEAWERCKCGNIRKVIPS